MVEELPDLPRFQPRRWLVENDEPAAFSERTRDLEPLALADRQFARHLVNVDIEPPGIEFAPAQPAKLGPVDRTASGRRVVVEEEVLTDRQVRNYSGFLVNAGHPRPPERPRRYVRR